MSLMLPREIADTIAAAAAARAPREACGVVALARAARTMRLVELTNVAEAEREYRADPAEVLELWQAMEDAGEVPHVIWHSHPSGPAIPSRHDVDHAGVPSAFYLIHAVALGHARAWRIEDGAATEHRVVIKEAGA